MGIGDIGAGRGSFFFWFCGVRTSMTKRALWGIHLVSYAVKLRFTHLCSSTCGLFAYSMWRLGGGGRGSEGE